MGEGSTYIEYELPATRHKLDARTVDSYRMQVTVVDGIQTVELLVGPGRLLLTPEQAYALQITLGLTTGKLNSTRRHACRALAHEIHRAGVYD